MYRLFLSLASGFPVAVKNVITRKIVFPDQKIEAYMEGKILTKSNKEIRRSESKAECL